MKVNKVSTYQEWTIQITSESILSGKAYQMRSITNMLLPKEHTQNSSTANPLQKEKCFCRQKVHPIMVWYNNKKFFFIIAIDE